MKAPKCMSEALECARKEINTLVDHEHISVADIVVLTEFLKHYFAQIFQGCLFECENEDKRTWTQEIWDKLIK